MKVEPYLTVIQDTEKILLAYAQWTPIKYLASNPFEQKNISKESHESKCPWTHLYIRSLSIYFALSIRQIFPTTK